MAHPKAPRVGAKSIVSPSERITSAVKQLAVSAADVKSAADELCGNIAPFEAVLAKFDLGVSAWYQIAGHELDNGSYWSRDLGYTKIGKKWGIALRKVEGHHAAEFDDEEIWFFKDAPRWMQVESATKIPDLFDALVNRASETIKNLRTKSHQTRELTEALKNALTEIGGAAEVDETGK